MDLRDDVETQLDHLNPGDWIIIGPGAGMEKVVPAHRAGHINVLATNVSVLRETLDLMERDDRLGPRLWVCREPELTTATTRISPGAARQRNYLQELLSGRTHFAVDERIIQLQLRSLAPDRKVLFIHTDTTLPHSSIGIELDYAGSTAAAQASPALRTPYQHADFKP